MASLSHYVRNLLQSIHGSQHLMDEAVRVGNADDIRSIWPLISQKQEELASVLMDCVALIEPPSPDSTPTDLNRLLMELVSSLQQAASNERVRIAFAPDEQPGQPIRLDPALLAHAMENILRVSIRSCTDHSEGHIDVRIDRGSGGSDLRIDVFDDGVRLQEDQQQSLFDPKVYTSSLNATGISLAVARHLISLLNGKLTVENNEGPGKHFSVCWPSADDGQVG